MKDFKLLLATTAILSAGAIVANANQGLPGLSDSTPLEVKAEIIKNISFESVRAVDFGRIAWDSNGGSLSLTPDGDGYPNFGYNGPIFHDGGDTGKVCFTEIIEDTPVGGGLTVTVASIESIKDNDNHEIAEYIGSDETPDYVVDAGATNGVRCVYIGGELVWKNNQYAEAFTGNVSVNTTVTVIYDPDD